ncbi:response regulator [Cohnella terricola]|uniref:Response regulator n=1 Tax=Cohnella terricola TaxID=1289167 RepID=A0A559JT12_9BACL|nr:response regulator [Cohnella terricola]TVY03016.1 response regulator [Cohnella terricola]
MKIMIVDDEVIIRNGLCTVIDWKELGLELIPPAASAEEALERIPTEKPDILLTDIRMSGMDGIELAKEVKEMLPGTEVLILTGYDDFSYAQQALRGGVTDYLLKTSRPEEIIKAAMKAKQNIVERQEWIKQEMLQQTALNKQALLNVLNGGLDDERGADLDRVREWFRKQGMNKPGDDLSLRVMLLSASGWGEKPFDDLLHGAVDNILCELLPCMTLVGKDRLVLVAREETGVSDRPALERIQNRVEEILKCTVFSALGSLATSYEGLKQSYQDALEVYAYKGLIGSRGLFAAEDIKGRAGGRTLCTEKEEAELSAILMNNDATALRHWVNQTVRNQLEDPAVTPVTLRAFLHSLVVAGYRWAERTRAGLGDPSPNLAIPASLSFEWDARPEDEVFKQLSAAMAVYHQSMDQTRFSYIHKAIAYIKDHLDQPLSLNQVAGIVHSNPNHFSEVFKRETGMTYLEFVTRERMRKAAEILQCTPSKVADVAKRVGYVDIKYFTQQFKKHTGKTPSEFRQHPKEAE